MMELVDVRGAASIFICHRELFDFAQLVILHITTFLSCLIEIFMACVHCLAPPLNVVIQGVLVDSMRRFRSQHLGMNFQSILYEVISSFDVHVNILMSFS